MSEKFTACRVKETDHTGFNLLEGVAQCLLVNIERGNFAVRDSSGGADDASGNNTVATAIAPRHGDALTHRAVTPSVESHLSHCWLAVGSLTPGHLACAARCKANWSA